MKLFREPLVLCFALVALGFLIAAGFLARALFSLSEWPRVEASVLKSSVVTLAEDSYQGQLRVRYRAGNQDREKLLDSGFATSSLSLAEATVADYPAGKPCRLPLNPNDTEDIRLPPGPGDWIMVLSLGGGGMLFLLIPVGVVALSRRADALRLVGFAFSALGLLLFGLGVMLGWNKVHLLRSWPAAEATVVSSQLQTGGRRYWLSLELAYRVEDREYQVGTASSWQTTSPQSAENQLQLWPSGSKHMIRYRPTSPEVISFEAAWSLSYFFDSAIFLGVGAALGLVGLLVVRFLGKPD